MYMLRVAYPVHKSYGREILHPLSHIPSHLQLTQSTQLVLILLLIQKVLEYHNNILQPSNLVHKTLRVFIIGFFLDRVVDSWWEVM